MIGNGTTTEPITFKHLSASPLLKTKQISQGRSESKSANILSCVLSSQMKTTAKTMTSIRMTVTTRILRHCRMKTVDTRR